MIGPSTDPWGKPVLTSRKNSTCYATALFSSLIYAWNRLGQMHLHRIHMHAAWQLASHVECNQEHWKDLSGLIPR